MDLMKVKTPLQINVFVIGLVRGNVIPNKIGEAKTGLEANKWMQSTSAHLKPKYRIWLGSPFVKAKGTFRVF